MLIRVPRRFACLLDSRWSRRADDAAGARNWEFRVQEISKPADHRLCCALLDMNEDGKSDILVVDTDRVVWFERRQRGQMHTLLLEDQTQ